MYIPEDCLPRGVSGEVVLTQSSSETQKGHYENENNSTL